MLHLYQSNRLDTLATLLQGVLSVPPADPYARETVIVQARGMGRWLSLQIAERFGVCANVDFPLPAGFLWRLIETVLGPQPRSGPFGSDALSWRLHEMLQHPPEALAPYLADGNERKRWRLASRIADVFDQYLVYRPDWLEQWEAGQTLSLGADEAWQVELWRALALDRSHAHRADLMKALIRRLQDPAPLPLPERVVLFGSSSLPPLLLQILQALSQRIDVALFALNPSAAAWGDISQRSEAQGPGERLLAAWGAQGRVFFDELAAADALTDLFDDTEPAGRLLAQLQYDVLTLAPREPLTWRHDDSSLAIHACHSPLRQVETLKDALLARFAADPSLQPAEVVVLCPDINGYAPYIDAVFGQGEPHVPYAVADRGGLAASPLLAGWLELLRVPDGEWEADRLAALLDIPALAQQLGLEASDLPLLRDWIAAAGIRRLQEGDAFSWQAGIGRVLLGVALPTEHPPEQGLPLFAGLVPLGGLDLRFAARAAGLSRFARQLGEWQTALAAPRPLAEWASTLASWLPRWYVESEADQAALDSLLHACTELASLAERSGVDQPVGRVAVLEWFSHHLEQGSGAGGFLTGGVTFAQLMPMRNLPFRLVAVLGLDDGAFPRDSQPDGFDLIARHPRRGDRARALDERWLFLETLLAARDGLLLFYTGRDARNDGELPPSTVIADLLDAIDSGWVDEAGQPPSHSLLQHHPLQPFSPQRFASDAALPTFDARWAGIARLAGLGQAQPPHLAGHVLPDERLDEVALSDLLAFARDPHGWFLQRLGVRFERGIEALAHRELFGLERADERALLALAGSQADEAETLALLGKGAALLPEGLAGEIWAERAALRFAPAVTQWNAQGKDELAVDLKLDGLRLHGLLRGLGPAGLGLRQPGKLREGDRLAAWLQHLVLCLLAPGDYPSHTRLVGLEQAASYDVPPQAAEHLADWLATYRRARRQPLPLLPRSSLAYAEGLIARKDPGPERALAAAIKAWEGSEQYAGEGAFDGVRAIWRGQAPFLGPLAEDFAALAEQLLLPMLAHESTEKLL
ncbi:exodeoxyribonuclease V subunit gamma [Chitinimonas sp.]|uniref:exodeoxyribonuclease V subunit gamma n=1 Tax=Chitinimonas sp. TaxID=1934313 RepID=UPI002F93417A